MKIYLSADMEGITGATTWSEVDKSHKDYSHFQEQMTREVNAACIGAKQAGARAIAVKDAHWTGRNIIADRLPEEASLIRGWSGHPLCMVQELDKSYDAVVMIGYHSRAGASGNPLAHTLRSSRFASIKINEQFASEFLLHTFAAALFNVPVVFVSGDQGICQEVKTFNENIGTVAVNEGVGASVVSIHPRKAEAHIQAGVRDALAADRSRCRVILPSRFQLQVRFKEHMDAYRAVHFPGASKLDDYSISFETKDYFEVLRLLMFV